MRYIETKNPEVAFILIPWFIPTKEENEFVIGANLYQRLIEKPDDTFVLIAEENNRIWFVMVAYKDGNNCFVYQVRKEHGFKYSNDTLKRLTKWANRKGCTRIVGGTEDSRMKRLYIRKYGFMPSDNDHRFVEKSI